ncbi:hypothetical protein E2C01_085171 [Portunus trituberculatus]|uniref:Uncharacterized protein n=1 Tax=Portunus trituberculatus TaxID=210409 RepID=A0A5B7J9Q9_PORTR|nr:hypothetical protein [Portunus trituberculatus]
MTLKRSPKDVTFTSLITSRQSQGVEEEEEEGEVEGGLVVVVGSLRKVVGGGGLGIRRGCFWGIIRI